MALKNMLLKAFVGAHVAVYRATGGRLGGTMGKSPILLLTTTGRKTGQKRTVPLIYVNDGARKVIIASLAGAPENPAWYNNLTADPRVEVQVGKHVQAMKASTVPGEERARLWKKMTEVYPTYDDYQKKTTREIPVVLLEPEPR